MKRLLFFLVIMLEGKSLQAQKTDSLMFESYFTKVEYLKYLPEKLDSSLFWTDKMIREAHTPYQMGLAQFAKGQLISMGNWSYNGGEYAVNYLVNAINIFAKINNREFLHKSLNVLSICYTNFYNPENRCFAKRLHYSNLALKVQHDPTFNVFLPFTTSLLQNEKEANEEDYKEAIKVTKRNLEFWKLSKSLPHQMWRSQYLGELYWFLNRNLLEAEGYLLVSSKLAQKLNDQSFHSVCLGNLAMYGNQSRNYEKAVLYGETGLKHSLSLNNDFREAIFQDQLYIAYKALGRKEEAFQHKERAIKIYETIYQKSDSKLTNLMRERNAELQKRLKLEKQFSEQNQKQLWYGFGIIGLLLLIVYAIFNNYQLSKKNKEISEAMLQGQTTERKRVASDLHDNLGSTMSSIRWAFQAIDRTKWSDNEKEIFSNVQTMFDKAYDDIRLLSHNLLPEEFERLGLTTILQNFIRKINKNTTIRFDLKVEQEFGRVDKKIEFELYSICLELVNNIMKHSKASDAVIELSRTKNQIKLVVSDNGIGIFKNDSDGKGMKNVQARVESLNGTWKLQNTENEGFMNEILIPV